MFCVHCGAQQEDGSKFCTSCGKPLDTEEQQPEKQNVFCVHCGAQQEGDSKFCTSCGKPLDTEEQPSPAPEAAPYQAAPQFQNEAPYQEAPQFQGSPTAVQTAPKPENPLVTKLKALPKWVYAAVVGGIAVIVAAILIVVNITSTINLNDFVTVEVEGYSGYGTARVSIDWEAMEAKYGDKVKFSKEAKDKLGALGGYLDDVSAFDGLKGSVYVSLDKDSGLSNGDELHYEWDIDDELFKYVSCKLKYTEGTYTVEGLKEAETFDPFADLTVSFEGISTNGRLRIEYAGGELTPYDFECDTENGLANGDTITIYLDEYQVERCLEDLGKIPSVTEKTYTVEGLSEYITDLSQIPQEYLDSLKKEAEDAIYAYTAKAYGSNFTLSELTYSGYVLNTVKSAKDFSGNFNDLALIFSGTVSGKDEELPSMVVYYPIRYTSILNTAGEMSYEDMEGIEGYSTLDTYRFSTDGYFNPLLCYSAMASRYGDNYTVTAGDGFESYSQAAPLTQLSQLSEDFRDMMNADALALIQREIADYDEKVTATEPVFVGQYLLTRKEAGSLAEGNYYVTVFKAEVSHSEGKFETTTVYFPVGYQGIYQIPEKGFTFISRDKLWGRSSFPDTYYSTKGYLDGTQMYADIVTANRDNYSYEVSEGLQEFGK